MAMRTEEIIAEIEFSLSLLEPPAFRVKPTALSFKKGWFSGIWAKYKTVDVFIPHNELKKPYHLRSVAEDLVRNRKIIKAYPLRIEENRDPRKWRIPIFTMFSPDDRLAEVEEAGEIKQTGNIVEVNIKKGTVIEERDFKLKILNVEYNVEYYDDKGEEKRPKSVILRITAPSKYPIIRPEQKEKDWERWEKLSERSQRRASVSVTRFFYKKAGKNTVEIGEMKITLLPFFSEKVARDLRAQGYVGKLKIIYPVRNEVSNGVYPRARDLERGEK